MKTSYIRAFKELIAALGGEKNIIQYGRGQHNRKKIISIQLVRTDIVKKDAFIFFSNVYCLMQSQGVTFEYFESAKMELFFAFLLEFHMDKYAARSRKNKILISRKFREEMAIEPRTLSTEESSDEQELDEEDLRLQRKNKHNNDLAVDTDENFN